MSKDFTVSDFTTERYFDYDCTVHNCGIYVYATSGAYIGTDHLDYQPIITSDIDTFTAHETGAS